MASPGNSGNLLQHSRKTMAPVINHPHEAGTEYRASYLLASVDSSKPFVDCCKVTIIDEKQKGSIGRALLPVCSWRLIKAGLMPGKLSVQKWESTNVYKDAYNQIYVLARKWRKKWLPNRGKKVLVLTQKERPSLMNKTYLFKMLHSCRALSCFAFCGEILGLPLDQRRRNVLWTFLCWIYLKL